MKNQYSIVLFSMILLSQPFHHTADLKASTEILHTQTVSLNGNNWRIAVDSTKAGIPNAWFKAPPVSESRQTPVPWVIQDIFHDYHGYAWYWREFDTPKNPHSEGRYLLRFKSVDYKADVWVNGHYLGGHEGIETPFEMDVTPVLNTGGKNLLVVRVLNPTYEPIDAIALKEVPSSLKHYPYGSNAVYNSGGIIGDVELIIAPAVRIRDLNLLPDWKTGAVKAQATVLNTQQAETSAPVSFKISEARTGSVLAVKTTAPTLKQGSTTVEAEIHVPEYKLWHPDDPVLYRAEISVQALSSIDFHSGRFGFRDFRYAEGYFRLNGKRIFLKGSNFSTHYPATYTVPLYEEMLRRDVVNMKALGFNFVRIPFGCPNPRVLDIYDELGMMVLQEHYGSWQIGQYGRYVFPTVSEETLASRFEESIRGVVLRDRNHASVIMWGMLNENPDNTIFRKAVDLLPSLRELDPHRIFILNSGRHDHVKSIGSMSNPGSETWNISFDELVDWHPYVNIPFNSATLDQLAGRSKASAQRIFITESGLCAPIDLPAELGDYQLWGKEQSADAVYFKRQYDKFLADWARFDLGACWPRPEDCIKDAYITAGSLRETLETAIRSNPLIISYTPTMSVADYSMGESVATNFRRLKPELINAVLLANSSLRWCLSTEPQSMYSGDKVHLRASFSNLDVLSAGDYPATIRVVDPDHKVIYEKKFVFSIPGTKQGQEPPFVQNVFSEHIPMNGAAGRYHFLATLDRGGTALGGKTEFYVTDKASLPRLPEEIVVVGEDAIVTGWMTQHKVGILPLKEENRSKRQVILITRGTPESTTMLNIAGQMARGSVVIFLSPSTFSDSKNTTRWLPLAEKGAIQPVDAVASYYRADRWAKKHPVFEGMPSGGMMDYKYFRNIISLHALSQDYAVGGKGAHTFAEASLPLKSPSETICGATRISHTYCSGIHLGVWEFGQGRFIVNTLHISENLGKDPAADRLFCNLLNYAAKDTGKPMGGLPGDFDRSLVEIGYKN